MKVKLRFHKAIFRKGEILLCIEQVEGLNTIHLTGSDRKHPWVMDSMWNDEYSSSPDKVEFITEVEIDL